MSVNIIGYDNRYFESVFRLLLQLSSSVDVDTIGRNLSYYSDCADYNLIMARTYCDRIVGFAAVHYFRFIHHRRPVCRIVALVVDEDFRAKGVGRLIVDRIEGLSIANGCEIIELTSGADRGHTGVFKFYEKCGYIDQFDKKKYFRKRLISL